MIRSNTLKEKLMSYLMEVGWCYKSDLYMIGKMNGDESNSIKEIKRMYDDGLIEEKVETNKKRLSVVGLTKKGYVEIANKMNERGMEMSDEYKKIEKEFHMSRIEALKTKVSDNRIKTMMMISGVHTTPTDKPSLAYLVETIQEKTPAANKRDKVYNDSLTYDQCKEKLSNGIYYTMKEFRDFVDGEEEGTSDMFMGTRARGIFISQNNCFVVYIAEPGNNRLIRVRPESEKRLMRVLMTILRITDVQRDLPMLSKRRISKFDKTEIIDNMIENNVYALVISDRDSLVYSMATGNPRGRIIGKDKMLTDKRKQDYHDHNNTQAKSLWLKGDGSIYQRMFVTPFTENGIHSLEYLCNTSAEEWYYTSINLFKDKETFEINNDGQHYPAYELSEQKIPAIYMPVFEVNELYRISNKDYNVTIVTYEDMVNAIARSIRKDVHYYDADTLNKFDDNITLIYDYSGLPKGQKMISDELLKQNQECDYDYYQKLPSTFGYDKTKFYNEVARKRIDLNKLLPSIHAHEIVIKPQKRIRRKSITLTMGEELTDKIYQAAKLNNVSASVYIKNIIYKTVNDDAAKYKELLKTNRSKWQK